MQNSMSKTATTKIANNRFPQSPLVEINRTRLGGWHSSLNKFQTLVEKNYPI